MTALRKMYFLFFLLKHPSTVPKVASSSISEVLIPFLKEIKSPPKKFPFPQAEVWARAGRLENQEQVNNTKTFLIVRHPLVRIASAYRRELGNYYYIYSQVIREGNWSISPGFLELPTWRGDFLIFVFFTKIE